MFPLLRANSEQVEILRLFVVESRILGIGIRELVGGRLGQECLVLALNIRRKPKAGTRLTEMLLSSELRRCGRWERVL